MINPDIKKWVNFKDVEFEIGDDVIGIDGVVMKIEAFGYNDFGQK